MMKKLLSFLLAAVMLLSGLAFAQGTELRLSDLYVTVNNGELSLDLSDICLRLALAGSDTAYGLQLGVDAADQPVAAVTAMLDNGRLLLGMDGLSNTYCVDIASILNVDSIDLGSIVDSLDLSAVYALAGAFSTFLGEVMATMTPEENNSDSIDAQYYSFTVSEDAINRLYYSVAEALDNYPALAGRILSVNGMQYNSFVEFCEQNPLRLSAIGVYAEGEDTLGLDIYISNGDEPEMLELYGLLGSSDADENGDANDELYLELNLLDSDLNVIAQGLIGDVTLSRDAQTGDAAELKGYLLSPTGDVDENGDQEYEGVYFGALSADRSAENAFQFFISSWDESVYADLLIAENSCGVRYQEEDITASIFYTSDPAADHARGRLDVDYIEGDQSLVAGVNFEAVESDGSWLNLSADGAVNLLAMDDMQQQRLSSELMLALMDAVSALASANQSIASLLGSL